MLLLLDWIFTSCKKMLLPAQNEPNKTSLQTFFAHQQEIDVDEANIETGSEIKKQHNYQQPKNK